MERHSCSSLIHFNQCRNEWSSRFSCILFWWQPWMRVTQWTVMVVCWGWQFQSSNQTNNRHHSRDTGILCPSTSSRLSLFHCTVASEISPSSSVFVFYTDNIFSSIGLMSLNPRIHSKYLYYHTAIFNSWKGQECQCDILISAGNLKCH